MATTIQKLTLEEQISKAKLRALAQGIRIWKLKGTEIPMYAVPSTTDSIHMPPVNAFHGGGEYTVPCSTN